MPGLIRPMLATAVTDLPGDDDAYGYEFKWDGVRAVTYLDAGGVRVLSRNDRDVTVSYPEVAVPDPALAGRDAVLDGEIVAFDAAGRPSFSGLQDRMHVTDRADVSRRRARTPVTYLVFDLLALDGDPLLDEPYQRRRARLDDLGLGAAAWQVPPWFPGGGADVLAASRAQGLEGIVAKRLGSRYRPGRRSPDWLKRKNVRTQDVVVGGYRPGAGRRGGGIGSLLAGVYEDDGLHYAGHVGSGLSDAALAAMWRTVQPLSTPVSPFHEQLVAADRRDAVWLVPELVGEVAFTQWTPDGRLRHPVWRGLRGDRDPHDVRREPG